MPCFVSKCLNSHHKLSKWKKYPHLYLQLCVSKASTVHCGILWELLIVIVCVHVNFLRTHDSGQYPSVSFLELLNFFGTTQMKTIQQLISFSENYLHLQPVGGVREHWLIAILWWILVIFMNQMLSVIYHLSQDFIAWVQRHLKSPFFI